VIVGDADQVEIVHECAECERLLFGDGKVDPLGDKGGLERDAVSMIP